MLPPNNNIIQTTYYQTAIDLKTCFRNNLLMTSTSEKVVKLRLLKLERKQQTIEELMWCLQMLSRVPHNSTVVSAALSVVSNCSEVTMDLFLRDCSTQNINSVCQALLIHRDNPTIQSKCYTVLSFIVKNSIESDLKIPLISLLMHEYKIINIIISSLVEHVDERILVGEASMFLSNYLILDPETCWQLRDEGLQVIFSTCDNYLSSVDELSTLLGIIHMVASVPTLSLGIEQFSKSLSTLLQLHYEHPSMKVCYDSMRLLCDGLIKSSFCNDCFNLGSSVSIKESVRRVCSVRSQLQNRQILESDLQPVLSTSIEIATTCSSLPTIAAALALAHRITFCSSLVVRPSAVLAVINQHYNNPAVVREANAVLFENAKFYISTLTKKSSLEIIEKCLNTTGVDVVNNTDVYTRISSLLCRVWKLDTKAVSVCLSLGFVDKFIEIIINLYSDSNALMHCSAALLQLCSSSENRIILVEAINKSDRGHAKSFMEVITASISIFSEVKKLQGLLCALLGIICAADEESAKEIVWKGADRMTRQLIDENLLTKSIVTIHQVLVWVRCFIVNENIAMLFATKQGFELLIDTAQLFGRMTEETCDSNQLILPKHVLLEASLCLLRLALCSPDINDSLTKVISESAVGCMEIVRVQWDVDEGEFYVAESAFRTNSKSWLNSQRDAELIFGEALRDPEITPIEMLLTDCGFP